MSFGFTATPDPVRSAAEHLTDLKYREANFVFAMLMECSGWPGNAKY
jgi:hypothetical protein